MALFAKEKETPISAADANPRTTYLCLECNQPLRLKKGRIPHFFHLRTSPSCRLYSKSERHLLIQMAIQKELPTAILERRFPSIERIGDVCWEELKTIFEVQCSPLSEREARERIRDYQSLGYGVIWILDTKQFNQLHVGKTEIFLREHPSYFVSGNGPFIFYDQLERIEWGQRIKKSFSFPIDWKKSFSLSLPIEGKLPRLLAKRSTKTSIFFENDLIDNALFPSPSFETLLEEFSFEEKRPSKAKTFFQKWIVDPYTRLIDSFLHDTR